MIPTQAPGDEQLRGDAWAGVFNLPTHRTNADGTQGAAIDWTGSTFTVDCPDLPLDGAEFGVVAVLSGGSPSVTLSLSPSVTIAITAQVIRFYLAENVVLGRTFLMQTIAMKSLL